MVYKERIGIRIKIRKRRRVMIDMKRRRDTY